MLQEILKSVRVPADVYGGSDRAKLKKLVRHAWRKKYPNDTILGIRAHHKAWRHNKGVHWVPYDKSFQKYDNQSIALIVIVKKNAVLATLYPAFINRDNIRKTQNIGVDSKGSSYVVRDMLLKNLK